MSKTNISPGLVLLIFSLALFPLKGGAAALGHDAANQLTSISYGGGKQITYTYDAAGNITGMTVAGDADTDGDGMPDSWEMQYFGSTSRNGLADLDGDGMSDYAEYIARTNPADLASTFELLSISRNPDGGVILQWFSQPDVVYSVERSSTVQGGYTPIQVNLGATPFINTYTDNTAIGFGPNFYRIRGQ